MNTHQQQPKTHKIQYSITITSHHKCDFVTVI
jgi:hypothetical protein